MRQLNFEFIRDYKRSFGGEDLIGRRKSQRPLSTKCPTHLVLKSNLPSVFNPGDGSLNRLIRRTANKFDIQIYDLAINWSHIHFLIQVFDRKDYVRFIRALTSYLAMCVKKRNPDETTKLFTLRPFTRIVSWGRDYKNTIFYVFKNILEAGGWLKRDKTKKKSKKPKLKTPASSPPKKRRP